MPRTMVWCTVILALALPAWADQQITSKETIIRLIVQPMAAPKPALRYLLLPELKEMNPGNPIPNYLRCLMDQDFSADNDVLGASALRQADRAARLDKPDWQILLKAKTDGVNLLLPDLQKIRVLANALQARFRNEIALRHFDDALVTAKTMFAMSKHVGEHPTLIGGLVGIAIASITIAPLEEMLEQPGCPNLYWALTNLPNPLVSLERGMEGERMLITGELRDLDDNAPMTALQLSNVIAHIDKLREFDPGAKKLAGGVRGWLNTRSKDEASMRAARRRLVEYGLPEQRLAKFPAGQILLLDERREFEVRRDEFMKLINLPAWQCAELTSQIKPSKDPALLEFFTPAFLKVRLAQGRLEQRIALLRHIEALRFYAADHDGRLPGKLADITAPLLNDPFSGKPFRYQVDGNVAHLRGTPPRGSEDVPVYNLHYEVTLQK